MNTMPCRWTSGVGWRFANSALVGAGKSGEYNYGGKGHHAHVEHPLTRAISERAACHLFQSYRERDFFRSSENRRHCTRSGFTYLRIEPSGLAEQQDDEDHRDRSRP